MQCIFLDLCSLYHHYAHFLHIIIILLPWTKRQTDRQIYNKKKKNIWELIWMSVNIQYCLNVNNIQIRSSRGRKRLSDQFSNFLRVRVIYISVCLFVALLKAIICRKLHSVVSKFKKHPLTSFVFWIVFLNANNIPIIIIIIIIIIISLYIISI